MTDNAREANDAAHTNPIPFALPPHRRGTPFALRRGAPAIDLSNRYVIKGLIQQGDLGVFYGAAGSGKTFETLHLATCIASGRDFLGRRVRTGGVLYVAAEAAGGIGNRIRAACDEHELPHNLPLSWLPRALNLATDPADGDDLILTLRENPEIKTVIIDTVSRVLGGADENAPQGMGELIATLDRIRADTGVTVILVHHTGKDAGKGLRGHSSLTGAADFVCQVINHGELCEIKVEKVRDGIAGWSLYFRLGQAVLGRDDDDDEITTCIVEPVSRADGEAATSSGATPRPRGRPRKSDELADLAFNKLVNVIAEDGGEDPPASSHIPRGVRVVAKSLWRRHLEMAGLINPAGKREELRRVIISLQARGRIGAWGEVVWPVPEEGRHKNQKNGGVFL